MSDEKTEKAAEEKQPEKRAPEKKAAPPESYTFCNTSQRVKFVSVKDGRETKSFMCVPTQTVTIPARYMPLIAANKVAHSILKSMKQV